MPVARMPDAGPVLDQAVRRRLLFERLPAAPRPNCWTCWTAWSGVRSVSIAHGAPDFLRPIAVLEAGSVPTLRLLPGIPSREGSAMWQAYASGAVVTGNALHKTCAGVGSSGCASAL